MQDPKDRPTFEELVEILNEEMGEDLRGTSAVNMEEQPPQSNYGDAPPSSSSAEGPYSAIDTSTNLKNASQPGSQEGTKYKGMPSNDNLAKASMNINNSTIHELPEEDRSNSDSGSSSSGSSPSTTGASSS